MICEICGNEVVDASLVIFEGARVYACTKCIRKLGLAVIRHRGKVGVSQPIPKPRLRPAKLRGLGPVARELKEYVLVEGYGKILKKAREARGLTQEALARLVGEKASVIRLLELERLTPPRPLIGKLEGILKIRLLESIEEVPLEKGEAAEALTPTLGDVAIFREEGER